MAEFEEYRSHLFGVAYRMLGSRAEAEDAVQEAWLRYSSARPEVDDLRAWLTTVVGRICLDVLRSARVRREAYVGSWLPEPIVSRLPDPAPEPGEHVARAEQVSLALLVVLDRLGPEQRLAFVLHDVFAVPFEEIATALDTSVANARQLAARARRAVSGSVPARPVGLGEQRRVLDAFLDAAKRGDLVGLARVLAPEVTLVGDGGGLAPALRQPLQGPDSVARFEAGIFQYVERRDARMETVLVNGDLGWVIESAGNLVVIVPVVEGGRVVAIYHLLNPEKLRGVPRPA